MPAPTRLLQLTDTHFGARWQPAAPADTLRAVIDAVRALPQLPDAAIHTGDLVNNGAPAEYAELHRELGRLGIPVHVIPGNHDDRATLRRHFDHVGGDGGDPIQYAVDLPGLRVLMLDSTRAGEPAGEFDDARRWWLTEQLARAPQLPTLLAMHHPPFLTGMAGMDGFAPSVAEREQLGAVIAAHPQIVGVVSGHVHRSIVATLGGRPAVTIPSAYAQSALDFTTTALPMVADPVGFAVHMLVDGRLVSHVQSLPVTAAAG